VPSFEGHEQHSQLHRSRYRQHVPAGSCGGHRGHRCPREGVLAPHTPVPSHREARRGREHAELTAARDDREAVGTLSGLEPGSFRDPDSRVFTSNGRVLRLLSEQGLADWRALSSSPLFEELEQDGSLVGTREVEAIADVPGAIHGGVAGVLEHDVIPFVSYPYEWSFSMLRDAALLQLALVRRAIEAGMILKDSSPYNVQFKGAEPTFIDVGSFEQLREGEPWAGYRQFCMLFLYPLLLQAWKDVPFQPWLRGSLDGISPHECRSLLSPRDRFRRGTFTHVVMHDRLERRYEAIKPHLSERQRRIWLGSEARELGSGGVRLVADAVQVSPDTVRRGRSELDDPEPLPVAARGAPAVGANAPRNTTPSCPRRWTSWSTPTRAETR